MKKLTLISIFTLTLLLGACTSIQGNYTVLSSKEIDLTKRYTKTADKIETKSAFKIYFVIPVGPFSEGNYLVALKKAEKENNIDYIGDAIVKLTSWYVPFIYGVNEISITGVGYKAQ